MKHSVRIFIIGLSLALGACGRQSAHTSIRAQNENPLTASRYGDELADAMANLVIQNDDAAKNPAMRKIIDAEIARGKKMGTDARMKQDEGMKGGIIAVKEEAAGYVLYVDDTLYLPSDFTTKPGPDLHVYLTVAVDPRDVAFPDKTAMDLGEVQNVYGAQRYEVKHQENPMLYRTFVLFDTKLKRIYGFAQLSK